MTVRQLPAALRWAVWLLGVEAVITLSAAVLLGYLGVTARPGSVSGAFAVAGFVALLASVLAGLAVALTRRKPRARAPAIVFQLMAVMFAWVLLASGVPLIGVPLGLLGLIVGTLLLTPHVGAALSENAAR